MDHIDSAKTHPLAKNKEARSQSSDFLILPSWKNLNTVNTRRTDILHSMSFIIRRHSGGRLYVASLPMSRCQNLRKANLLYIPTMYHETPHVTPSNRMLLRLWNEVANLQSDYNTHLRKCVAWSVQDILEHREKLEELATKLMEKRKELANLFPGILSTTN